jgi:hypothetical protein
VQSLETCGSHDRFKKGRAFCYPHGPITGFCAKLLLYQQLPEVQPLMTSIDQNPAH